MTQDPPPNLSSSQAIPDNEITLRKLDLEEKKAEREYEIRLREVELKEAEIRRSKWSNPLVLALMAAFIAATGNLYISWLNGENQLRIESNRNASQKVLEEQKAEAARILEATKNTTPEEAAKKLRFLIDVKLITDPNRQAALEEYLDRKESTTTSPVIASPIIEKYSTGWMGGGHDQRSACANGRASIVQKYPGKSVLLLSSSEQSKKDFLGRVEYKYFCTFQVQ